MGILYGAFYELQQVVEFKKTKKTKQSLVYETKNTTTYYVFGF